MGTRLFKVSDISGRVVEDEAQLTQIIVQHHPNFDEPIGLEVLPEELEGQLPETEEQEYVIFSYTPAGATEGERYLLPLPEFNRLFPNDNATAVLERVYAEQQEAKQLARGRGRSRTQPGQRRQRVDYSSPEHAGEPHRGIISEAEKTYVRDHIDKVNERLRRQGLREIDPANPEMAERYGLPPTAHDDAEAEGEMPRV